MAGLPVEVVGYGHLGDGNLHLNVSCQKYDEEILKHIEPFVYEWTAARKGSISAEHGLGQMKADCIGWASLQTAIAMGLLQASLPLVTAVDGHMLVSLRGTCRIIDRFRIPNSGQCIHRCKEANSE